VVAAHPQGGLGGCSVETQLNGDSAHGIQRIEIRSPRRMSFGKVAKRCFYASENVTHWLNRKPACYYTRNTPFFWLLRCRNVS